MSKKRLFGFISTALLIALLLSGCGKGQNALKGEWIAEDGSGEKMEFLSDGTLILTTMGIQTSGTYSVIDQGKLKIEMDGLIGLMGPTILSYEIRNKNLMLNFNGMISTYRKK